MSEDAPTGSEPEDGTAPEDADGDGEDWAMSPEADAAFEPDAEKRDVLRAVAADVRGRNSEADQVAAIVERVSDLYDPEEDTSPKEIYLNMQYILEVMEQGGIER